MSHQWEWAYIYENEAQNLIYYASHVLQKSKRTFYKFLSLFLEGGQFLIQLNDDIKHGLVLNIAMNFSEYIIWPL